MTNLYKSFSKLLAAAALSALAVPAFAEGDLTRQDANVITIDIGAKDGTTWEPNHFELETGKLYRMVFTNSSDNGIYVIAPDLVKRIFTRKVQTYRPVDGDMERTSEIKGNITEVEVFGGQQVDWWFVPLQDTKEPMAVCCTAEKGVAAATLSIK